ncbi:putative multidrug resistance-associated protein lethal(2)03659-like protein, partial [Leptotrombidium deliense]
ESDFLALKDINLRIEPGELIIIVGPVGSGKTCLLMALLNEVEKVSGNCMITGKTSYTPQEAWCFNGSVKSNIIFGRGMQQNKYDQVIDVCCLPKDLESFAFGDETLIGEKGITLSGGQKARISLARAVYDDADFYIFDDPLSAVDSEVANHIFQKCIQEYLNGKTRILVTHNLQFLNKADKVVVMKDGICLAFGTPQQLVNSGIDLTSIIRHKDKNVELNESDYEVNKSDKQNEMSEKSKEEKSFARQERKQESSTTGSLQMKVHIEYFKAGTNLLLTFLAISGSLFSQIIFQFVDYWLALWMDNTKQTVLIANNDTVVSGSIFVSNDETRNVTFYAILMLFLLIGYTTRFWSLISIGLRAAANLHNKIFQRLLRSPISFFENNPKGRILNRFTGDVGQLDQRIPMTVVSINTYKSFSLKAIGTVIGTVIVTCVVNKYLIVICAVLIGVSIPLRKYYLRSVRNVKRYEAITRSPVFSCVSTTFDGLTCIRAFKLEAKCETQFQRYLNDNNACRFLLQALSRSFGFCCSSFQLLFYCLLTTIVSISLKSTVTGGEVGLLLSSALILLNAFQMCLRNLSEYETNMISAERVLEYTRLPSEAALFDESSKPKNEWPMSGSIVFNHVYLSYLDGQPILRDLCFTIESGSKIGVVGRTGAGKSSIVNALFRLVEFEGLITIDGVDIKKLGLNDLRKKLSIIPQDPIMFQGTIRSNIDPNNEYSDEMIWKTLHSVQLGDVFKAIPGDINATLIENGSNLSLGQRQLICMVRSLLKQNKILIMDEATANIDHETDNLIQNAIKECLHHCTVLTIAHRLNTVIEMDKIMVIDDGQILEFDVPYVLLNKEESHLKKMVSQLGDRSAHLYAIAKTRFEHLKNFN